jgi:hypothetical protein
MSKDLFQSILSMDAYNRGYNPSIAGLAETGVIGNATVITRADLGVPIGDFAAWQTASFYGLAYKLTQPVGTPGNLIAAGTTIISYRGTDQPA